MKLGRSLFLGAALTLPVYSAMVAPAGAANVDIAAIVGSGTISPGLTEVVQSQSISFTGTATAIGTDGLPGTYSCSFAGTGFGNAAGGTGTVSGVCGPLSFPACTFVFTGGHVTVACPLPVGVGAADCVFQPTDIRPTTRYNLVCGALLANGG
ncbi:MAG TPA: hypothetical protein VGX28_08680 [Frankiaceae bacterium]|jgi:hypothetical protein|nr:hypothetical protein [Frankiaceae bacterium]